MSDIIFYDSFSGSGDFDGHKPDIAPDGTTAWVVNPYSTYSFAGLSGGLLVANSSAGIGVDSAGASFRPDRSNLANRFVAELQFTLPAGFDPLTDMSVDLLVYDESDVEIVGGFIRYSPFYSEYVMEAISSDADDLNAVRFPISELVAGGSYSFRVERSELSITASVGSRSVTGLCAATTANETYGVSFSIGKNYTSSEVSVEAKLEANTGEFIFPMMAFDFNVLVEPILPRMTFEGNFGASVDFNFPMPSSEYVFASAIDFTFPMMTLDAGFVKNASFDFDLPMMRLDASFGGGSDWAFPAMTLDAKLTNTEGKNALDFDFPVMAFDGQMGGQVGFDFPIMTLEADMTATALIQVDFTFPAMTLDSELSGEPYKFSVDFLLPMMQVEAQFGDGAEFNLPMMTIDAHLQSGGLLNLDFVLPMMTLDAELTRQNHGAIEFTFPMMVPVHGITADFSIPMMQLDAHIKAVVSVTYEAYSVNLTHTSETPTDEVTRYTNYPFDQIVRLGGDYYGVATDGLYLLGGKLDNAQPIAYTVKTCIDDFKVKEFKNIASGYFGGRIGPDMKVTVFAGEQGEEAYDYSTPRGQGAQNHREKFGRGVKNRYYAIGVSGEEELVLDNIELEINKMTRRI